MSNLLSFVCLLMLYLGLSATLGVLMRTSIQNGRINRFTFLAFVLLPFTVGLPWETGFNVVAWVLGGVVTVVFYKQPANSVSFYWQERFALVYFGLLMLLVSVWSLFYEGQSTLWMTALALLAGIACTIRILRPKAI